MVILRKGNGHSNPAVLLLHPTNALPYKCSSLENKLIIQPFSVFWYLQLLQGQADVPAVPFKKQKARADQLSCNGEHTIFLASSFSAYSILRWRSSFQVIFRKRKGHSTPYSSPFLPCLLRPHLLRPKDKYSISSFPTAVKAGDSPAYDKLRLSAFSYYSKRI